MDESTAVYSASAWGEEAQEDPLLQNGVYTHFLLKSFKDDLDGYGAVQLSEAHTQATNLVIDYTKGAQHPSAQVEIVGQDPVVLSGILQKRGQWITAVISDNPSSLAPVDYWPFRIAENYPKEASQSHGAFTEFWLLAAQSS